ncbi:sodium:solute symporter family protein [Candidatus Magnetominusculus xianensis]|uniref:Na+:solute symporter n=1 Tax=Candidatus Magnetominusculus xianensis TaxID=1748249 RepID=A0ABR5SBD5_9BACT|nr:sodium:solute symporter family protein [Candidatus Magnetominusculus xianensis]KWT76383.1 Na+:solute symporter [Candidatus Magnetominusculus xianensis]MBF0405512.1 Na+:solute symporter [Nitrospirota bacterium]
MHLSHTDLAIILAYFVISLILGLYYTKKASSSTEEFFLSGRRLPWWLAGTSMVATTFSSDTPLYITALIRSNGVYENWQWWCFLMTGMLSVTVFAKLWKRAGVMTDVELTEMRYSGKSASFLRGFKAIYFSMFLHTIIKAQIILAMVKILDIGLGWDKWTAIFISSGVTIIYSLFAGYWGVIITDFFQFILAMTGSIILAVISVNKVGGLSALTTKVAAIGGGNQYLDFFPSFEGGLLAVPVLTFAAYIGLSWWAKYSSDGGGVVVQRMASCKSERDAIGATLFFNVANYALRSWPWILAALASLILYPTAKDNEAVYPLMAVELLPNGLRGLMFASFFAAFMSSIATYLNLSSAYFMKDFYMRFIAPKATEKHYLTATRFSMLGLSLLTAVVTYFSESIVGTFKFLVAFGSGTGLVFLMRWYWWRVNPWSEISAMLASTVVSAVIFIYLPQMPYYEKLFLIISISTVAWVVVTLLTRPSDEGKLIEFYKRVYAGGIGWRAIEDKLPAASIRKLTYRSPIWEWLTGTVFVYALTLSVGMLLLQRFTGGILYAVAGLVSGILLYKGLYGRGQGDA